MTTFPELCPSSIEFDLGQANISEEATYAGPIRFRHSARINNQVLRLRYEYLDQTEIGQLRAHFYENQSSINRFDLPIAIWGGLTVVPSTALCNYLAPFEEEQLGTRYNVTVELRIVDSIISLYILQCGSTATRDVEAVTTFAFVGYAPFILDGEDASVTATLVLNGGGASL